jgi:hypothetical protein
MPEINDRKLGLNPSKPIDLLRALYMPRYWRSLPPAPKVHDDIRGFSAWGFMGNDQWGDCVVASSGHAIQAWTVANAGTAITIPDANILSVYRALSPGDNGLDIGTFLKWLQKHGLVDAANVSHSVGPYGSIDPNNQDQVRQAIHLFGYVKIGIDLPKGWYNNADNGFVWDVNAGGIVGGHDVALVTYSEQGPGVVTWGAKGTVTWAGLRQYCSEAWVVLSPDYYATGKSPDGLDLAGLMADFAEVTGTQPPPPPPPPEPPAPPEPPRPWHPCRRGLRAAVAGLTAFASELDK